LKRFKQLPKSDPIFRSPGAMKKKIGAEYLIDVRGRQPFKGGGGPRWETR